MNRLSNKVCIITGGAGSLGLASARLLQSEGANIVLVDLSEDRLREAVETLDPSRTLTVAADVSDVTDVQRYVAATVDRFGGIDVLFSNAGNDGPVLPLTAYPEDDFDSVMKVHVRGSFLACKYTVPAMREGGSIIITSSIVGVKGAVNNCAYSTAKHALVGLARCLAKEVASRGIRVNTINPGPVNNPFMKAAEERWTARTGQDRTAFMNSLIPLGRHAEPEEIAKSVLYLASDDSSFTTGSALMVDGGMGG
ncbi:NAD(P)-dependent dehydrogenase (short-subunit alcohol dehydrogenase family) [Paraburkholderia sp. BL23I1N1]|uniref:SDR family NAD(P)-dependent oxidoreductase n=1 Tax=Paraburkholderia sp. BL23I1N1 TaxID=1938802 RepID=UPI000E71F544|nr:SDR family NAD(P)-dependent oxidoreductase [Paraburkholderia sp. BL23I1N1]RKE38575.1 NAD(P)-dependent dehydrogenase (short-subunit alcohol dehydrogenase family) [Paraburkholderia sp. BL23I1N1]